MTRTSSRAHARLSPSDSGRWLNCPGSINLTAGLGEGETSIYAAEGTFAHSIRETCLSDGSTAYDHVGETAVVDGYEFTWKYEDARYLQPGIDRINLFGGEKVVEYKVDLDRWMPGNFGTLDTGLVLPDLIIINDLKWGTGELVEAHRNTQQMIYALGFWQNVARWETKATDFLLMIDQPRAKRRGGVAGIEMADLDDEEDEDVEPLVPGEFRITLDELLEFGRELKVKARATKDPDAPRVPGKKQCRWCVATKVLGMCPEYENWWLSDLGITFDNLDESVELGLPVRPPKRLTPERRTALLRAWPEIKRWFETQHAAALLDALAGDFDRVPGLKAVSGREGNRVWEDAKLAEAWLSRKTFTDPDTLDLRRGIALPADQIFTKKLKSPAGIEKIIGTGNIPKTLIERGRAKPVLVPFNDPKPALLDRQIKFENLENEEND